MKKLIILLTTLTIMLVGCGNTNDNTSNSNQDGSTTSQVEEISVDLTSIVNEITSKVEWASLSVIDDDQLISEFFKLDVNNPNYQNILVEQCPMSAVIAEIILIQANDVNSAMEDLEVRKQKLIDTDAFYPEHKEIAEQSIVGSYGNIAYFLASDSSAESEKVLKEYLDSLT